MTKQIVHVQHAIYAHPASPIPLLPPCIFPATPDMSTNQAGASVSQTVYLESVNAKFDKNRPYAVITLLISIGSKVVSQKIEEGEPIGWLGQIDCTGADICTLKLYKKWDSRFPKLLACVDIPLKGLVVMSDSYCYKKDNIKIKFTLNFSSLSVQQGSNIPSTSSLIATKIRHLFSENLVTKFLRASVHVKSAIKAARSQKVMLNLLGDARGTAETIGSLLLAAGEVNPYAKAAASALKTLAKLCKKQEECSKATKELMKELENFLQIRDQALELKDRKETAAAVERMLELIAHISDYICEHASTRRFANMLSSKLKDKVEEFKKEFILAKDSFDRSVNLDVLKTIHELAQQFQLHRLQPAEALYKAGEDNVCLEGTRQSLLKCATLWLTQSPEQLFWVFGLAGSGKSAIANTIAIIISQMNDIDLTCYFCKRDDPALSKSDRFIPTIAYLIARKHSGYRARLIEVLSKSDGIPSGDIQKQYDLLIGDLLPGVADPLRTHVVVVDALDECGQPVDQRKLAACMLSLAKTVPWVKVFVTSRPESGIRDTLASDAACIATDINKENETIADIELFIRTKLQQLELTTFLDKVDELVQHAAGLFIWCSTLFKYLGEGHNAERDMEYFLSGVTNQDPLIQLYSLYDQILTSAIHKGHPEDERLLQAILGVIYVCSGNRPLSAEAIACFLRFDSRFARENSKSVSSLARTLHAVLYEEASPGKALRVCHPSFLDYLERKLARQESLIMDLLTTHKLMADGCLATLHKELKFNICHLEDPYLLNIAVKDLSERILNHISEALQYSTLFWFNHVSQCATAVGYDDVIRSVSSFVRSPEILYWLENLSLLNASTDGLTILRRGSTFFKAEDVVGIMSDMERFVLAYAEAMESAPHIYLSALAWLPEETLLYKTFSSTFAHLPIVANKEQMWEGARWTKSNDTLSHRVSYAPNGQYYAAGFFSGDIHVWNTQTNKQLHELKYHLEFVSSLVFSPDGHWLASASESDAVCIWNLVTGETDKILEDSSGVASLAFSLDSTRIASCSLGGWTKIWMVQSGNLIFNQDNIGSVDGDCICSVTFTADGEHVVSGSKSLQIWNISSGKAIHDLYYPDRVTALACSRDGTYIAAALKDVSNYAIKLWNAQTFETVGELLDDEETTHLSFTADSKQVFLCSDSGSIRIRSTGTLALTETTDLMDDVHSASFSPDFRSILISSPRNTVSIFDIQPEVTDDSNEFKHGAALDVVVSFDGRYVASCHEECNCIHIWDAKTGVEKIDLNQGGLHRVCSVAFSTDGRWLVSGFEDNIIRIWDITSNWTCGEPLAGHTEAVIFVSVSPDSRYIASCSTDRTLRIWEIESRLPRIFNIDCDSVSFFPDSCRVATASCDGGGNIFDILTGKEITHFSDDSVESIAVSPDGQWIAFTRPDSISLWEVAKDIEKKLEPELSQRKYHFGFSSQSSFIFTPDSRFLMVGYFGSTELWNVQSGTLFDEYSFHCIYDQITRTSFSPDSRLIILSYDNGAMHACDNWIADLASLEDNSGHRVDDTTRRARCQWKKACSELDFRDGWVKDDGGKLLMWVPERYREDVEFSRTLVIGSGRHRAIRPTINNTTLMDSLGNVNGWTSIFRSQHV